MDSEIEIMYQVKIPGGISRKQLKVDISDKYNRVDPLPNLFEKQLEYNWKSRCEANPKLWNGSKFRLDSVSQSNNEVCFHLGITNYRDFIGTNWCPNAKELLCCGSKIHNNEHAFMSDALGVGNLVITNDEFIILLRRSQHCGEAIGLLDVPGGHPEPAVSDTNINVNFVIMHLIKFTTSLILRRVL